MRNIKQQHASKLTWDRNTVRFQKNQMAFAKNILILIAWPILWTMKNNVKYWKSYYKKVKIKTPNLADGMNLSQNQQ